MSKDTLYAQIDAIAHSIESELNYNVSLIDIYENEENKSYTLRYEIFSYEKTLVSEQIENFHKNVINTFANNGISLK